MASSDPSGRPVGPDGTPRRHASPPLTRRDLPGVLAGLAPVAAFLVLTVLGHPWLAGAVFGGSLILFVRAMPKEQREAMGRAIEREQRRPIRRVLRGLELLLVLLGAAVLLRGML